MTQVTFYLLEEAEVAEQPATYHYACMLAANAFRQKRRALIWCDSQSQAEAMDELMWQRPVEGFIPHNLLGEGPAAGAPVEIAWTGQHERTVSGNRPLLINLSQTMPPPELRFSTIFDFVPADEALKPAARERYKQYRMTGFQLATQPSKTIYESNDG